MNVTTDKSRTDLDQWKPIRLRASQYIIGK
jgi:hypothetical protein